MILAVPHDNYLADGERAIADLLAPGGIVIDVKSRLDRAALEDLDIPVWRL